MRITLLVVATAILIFFAPFFRKPEQFIPRSVTLGNETYYYRVYVPDVLGADTKPPVILYLHGAGERGSDNAAQTRVGIGPALTVGKYPAIVVMPQCPEGRLWTDPEMRDMAMRALERTIREFNGDRNRIYLTGNSMGGYGVWSFAYHHPGNFAALVPLCGGVRRVQTDYKNIVLDAVSGAEDAYHDVAEKIGPTPVWAFEGKLDTTVPWVDQHEMIEALKAAGGNTRETTYEDLGHHIWDRTYADPELIRWIFAQSLSGAP